MNTKNLNPVIAQFYGALSLLKKENLEEYPIYYLYNVKKLVSLLDEEMANILGVNKKDVLKKAKELGNDDESLNLAIEKCEKLHTILDKLDDGLSICNQIKTLDFNVFEVDKLLFEYGSVKTYVDSLKG